MMVDLPSLMTLEAMRATTQAFTPRRACCTAGMSAKLDRHAAMTEISAIKVVAPNMLQAVVDQAIQIHGGAGVSGDTPLAGLHAIARALRLADGPDEVHRAMVARVELAKYKDRA